MNSVITRIALAAVLWLAATIACAQSQAFVNCGPFTSRTGRYETTVG